MLAAVASAVEIPFAFFGMPSGHDVEFHLYSWLEVLSQWKIHVFFPRWAGLAHFGYGEPRFLFYPPASWMLGATLAALFPWKIVPAIYIWIALSAAGAAMFFLAREFFDYDRALFAAALYMVNPYHLVIVYWRSALAELLASCLIPLLLLCVLRIAEGRRRALIPLAAVLAAAWLTNAPAAVMVHYSLALLLAWVAWQKRSLRPLWIGAAAALVGAGLAAFYLLPAIYEQRWVNIAEAVSAGSRPQDNFLFSHTGDADHDAFNRVVSMVAVFEVAVCLLAGGMARRSLRSSFARGALLIWAAVCAVLLLPITLPLWRLLPKLAYMQFPWRWLLCLSLAFAWFAAAAARDWWMRGMVCLASLAVVVGAARFVQTPWWDTVADLREMQDNMSDGSGYEGVDEYVPLGADSSAIDASAIDKSAPRVEAVGVPGSQFEITRWDAEFKSFMATMPAAGELRLRLFRYPAWQAEVNGRVVETTAQVETGQMLVPVPAGTSQVQISFARTWDRTAGGWITLASLLGAAAWLAQERLGARRPT